MSSPIITVEGLGKAYFLGRKFDKHLTLREAVEQAPGTGDAVGTLTGAALGIVGEGLDVGSQAGAADPFDDCVGAGEDVIVLGLPEVDLAGEGTQGIVVETGGLGNERTGGGFQTVAPGGVGAGVATASGSPGTGRTWAIRKPARPDSWRNAGLISGVLTKKCGRKNSFGAVVVSSVR